MEGASFNFFSAHIPASESLGKWTKLAPAGQFSARDGRGPFDAGDLASMQAIVDRTRRYHGTTDMMVDYDHQSLFGAKDGVGGRAPAAGWVRELEARSDGIYGRIEWTAAARAAITAGECGRESECSNIRRQIVRMRRRATVSLFYSLKSST